MVSVMYVRHGDVSDKSDFVFNTDAIVDSESLCTFLAEHYMRRDSIPRDILLSFDADEDDIETLSEFLNNQAEHRVYVKKPARGVNRELVSVVIGNAAEKARQIKLSAQKDEDVLVELAHLLRLETLPQRIEAYDISNIGKENITAGMVVYENGKPLRSDYRLFKMRTVSDTTDDYASMREALKRRIKHLKEDATGAFSIYPDLLLIDGGKGHVSTVMDILHEENVDIPVFGLVKDDFHKTRALCTENEEINIARERSVYMLIYAIQEEVHRFTVGSVNAAKRATLKKSSLEGIDGIGPSKAKKLLGAFGTLGALKKASQEEIKAVKGISETDARNVYEYFSKENKQK